MRTPLQSVDQLQNCSRFRLDDGLHGQMAGGVQNHDGSRCQVNIEPNLRSIIHDSVPLPKDLDANHQA